MGRGYRWLGVAAVYLLATASVCWVGWHALTAFGGAISLDGFGSPLQLPFEYQRQRIRAAIPEPLRLVSDRSLATESSERPEQRLERLDRACRLDPANLGFQVVRLEDEHRELIFGRWGPGKQRLTPSVDEAERALAEWSAIEPVGCDNALFPLMRARLRFAIAVKSKEPKPSTQPAEGATSNAPELYTEYQWGQTRQKLGVPVLEVLDQKQLDLALKELHIAASRPRIVPAGALPCIEALRWYEATDLTGKFAWDLQKQSAPVSHVYCASWSLNVASAYAVQLAQQNNGAELQRARQVLLDCARLTRLLADQGRFPIDLLVSPDFVTAYVQSPRSIIAALNGNIREQERLARECEMTLVYADNIKKSAGKGPGQVLATSERMLGSLAGLEVSPEAIRASRLAEYTVADQVGMTLPLAVLLLLSTLWAVPLLVARLLGWHQPLLLPGWRGLPMLVAVAGVPWIVLFVLTACCYPSWRAWSLGNSPWVWGHYAAAALVSLVLMRGLARRLVHRLAAAQGITVTAPHSQDRWWKRTLRTVRRLGKLLLVTLLALVTVGGLLVLTSEAHQEEFTMSVALRLGALALGTGLVLGLVVRHFLRTLRQGREAGADAGNPRPRVLLTGSVLTTVLLAVLPVQIVGVAAARQVERHYVRQYIAGADLSPRATRLGEIGEWVVNEVDDIERELTGEMRQADAQARSAQAAQKYFQALQEDAK